MGLKLVEVGIASMRMIHITNNHQKYKEQRLLPPPVKSVISMESLALIRPNINR